MPNGSVAVAATMSHDNTDPNGSFPDRGTGYNFFNAETGEWQDMPEEGAEGIRTGWPSIARWGETGEILISHAPMRCWTREVAGEGEWVLRGTLPPYPDGFEFPNDDASWPRVATSGANHNIIHVIADIQHSTTDAAHHWQVYYRSEDAENWTCVYSPLADYGEEYDHYTADSYNITANGHNVAMIYSDDLQSNLVMFKSTDDGLTWNRYDIWENPYYGYDWETDELSIFTDTVFGPCTPAIAIDNFGVTHVAVNTWEYMHSELGNSVSYFYGRGVDGIYYWNDTQEYPIQSIDGNPHHALRLWWPDPENPGYVQMNPDSTKWIGFVPMFEGYEWDNDLEFIESDYWYKMRAGASAMPALSIDPLGNIACAFSAPNVTRVDQNENKYKRSIFVSYYNANEGYWHQVEDQLDYHGEGGYLPFLRSENIFTNGVDNVVNPGEFWFSFQSDNQIGCWVGSNAYQTDASENTIHVVKVVHNPSAAYYTITATANPTNGGTVSGGGTYTSGSTCTLHATPNNGYSFVKWTKNGTQISTNPNYSFTVTGNASYVAHFQQSTTNYTITATANPSNAGSITGTGSYAAGSTCTLHATPNSGYVFMNWIENGVAVSTNANYSFTVTGNRNLVAVFDVSTYYYTISASVDPANGGVVEGAGSYASGSTCTLHATSNNGYSFVNWTKNGTQVSTNPNYSFTVTGNASYVAHFRENVQECTVTVSADPILGGAVSGAGTYPQGATCVLSAMPNDGFVFESWTINNIMVSSSPSYTFTVNRDVNCVAHFTQNANHFTITAIAYPVEGGAVSGSGTYEMGAACTLNAIASVGYEFVKWTLNGNQVSTEASFTFSVTSNAVYTAHFVPTINHYTVEVSIEPSSAGSVSGTGTFEEGVTCTLTAIPNPTYSFESWKENGTIISTEPSYSFIVNRDRSFVATFLQGQFYTISASAGPNGSISPEGDVIVQPGEDKTFTMIPNSGCRVKKVVVDGIDRGPVELYTIRNVNDNHSIRVEFSGLGVEDNIYSDLKVYPNPALDKINIESPNMKQVSVFSLFGIQVERKDVNDSYAVFSTNDLPQGTYILKVEYADGRLGYSRFVVAR